MAYASIRLPNGERVVTRQKWRYAVVRTSVRRDLRTHEVLNRWTHKVAGSDSLQTAQSRARKFRAEVYGAGWECSVWIFDTTTKTFVGAPLT